MATAGPRYPGSATSISGTWTVLTAAVLAADDRSGTSGAAYNPCTRNTNFDAEVGNFGFDALIPVGATIDSVVIEYQQAYSASTTSTTTVWPYVGGAMVGSGQAQTATPTADTTYSYDVFSLRSWTRADLLDGTFTVRHRVRRTATGTLNFFIDFIRVTVGYTPHYAPNAPVSAPATNVAETSFTANWAASVVDATHEAATTYYLDVATDEAFSMFVPGFTSLDVGNVTTYPVSGANITGNTSYWYRVRGWNAVNYSGNSTPQTLTTLAGGVFTPKVGGWRWYTDAATEAGMSALAAQGTGPTLTGAQMQNAILRLRVQLAETGGAGGTTGALELEYSGDGTNWQAIRAQVDSSLQGVWFRHANGAATDGATLGALLLAGSTAAGTYHETGAATQALSASAVTELDFPVLVHWPAPITSVTFRLTSGGTPLPLNTGATNPSLTTSAVADRPYTLAYIEPQPASTAEPQTVYHGANRRVFYDGTRWWVFYSQYNTSNTILASYWDGAAGAWSAPQSTTIGSSSSRGQRNQHYLKVINGTPVVINAAFSSSASTFKRGRISGTTITWEAQGNFSMASPAYGAVIIDDQNYWWAAMSVGTTLTAKRSTLPDDGSAGWTPTWGTDKTITDAETQTYRTVAMVPLGGGAVMVLAMDYGSPYRLHAAQVSEAGGFGTLTDVTALGGAATASTFYDWGAVAAGDYLYAVHTNSSGYGGAWRLAVYKISTNTWYRGPNPNLAPTTGSSDQAPVAYDSAANKLYLFCTANGPEGGEDRVIHYETYSGPGEAGTWDNNETTLSPGGRSNMDAISASEDGSGSKIVVIATVGDDSMLGTGFALEYHTITVSAAGTIHPLTITVATSATPLRVARVGVRRALSTAGTRTLGRRMGAHRSLSTVGTPHIGKRAGIHRALSSLGAAVMTRALRYRRSFSLASTGVVSRITRAGVHRALSTAGTPHIGKRAGIHRALSSLSTLVFAKGQRYIKTFTLSTLSGVTRTTRAGAHRALSTLGSVARAQRVGVQRSLLTTGVVSRSIRVGKGLATATQGLVSVVRNLVPAPSQVAFVGNKSSSNVHTAGTSYSTTVNNCAAGQTALVLVAVDYVGVDSDYSVTCNVADAVATLDRVYSDGSTVRMIAVSAYFPTGTTASGNTLGVSFGPNSCTARSAAALIVSGAVKGAVGRIGAATFNSGTASPLTGAITGTTAGSLLVAMAATNGPNTDTFGTASGWTATNIRPGTTGTDPNVTQTRWYRSVGVGVQANFSATLSATHNWALMLVEYLPDTGAPSGTVHPMTIVVATASSLSRAMRSGLRRSLPTTAAPSLVKRAALHHALPTAGTPHTAKRAALHRAVSSVGVPHVSKRVRPVAKTLSTLGSVGVRRRVGVRRAVSTLGSLTRALRIGAHRALLTAGTPHLAKRVSKRVALATSSVVSNIHALSTGVRHYTKEFTLQTLSTISRTERIGKRIALSTLGTPHTFKRVMPKVKVVATLAAQRLSRRVGKRLTVGTASSFATRHGIRKGIVVASTGAVGVAHRIGLHRALSTTSSVVRTGYRRVRRVLLVTTLSSVKVGKRVGKGVSVTTLGLFSLGKRVGKTLLVQSRSLVSVLRSITSSAAGFVLAIRARRLRVPAQDRSLYVGEEKRELRVPEQDRSLYVGEEN